MKIRGWHVGGFGVFADYRVAGMPDGLVVVHGANEAGKSTLLAFLRAVLFGFPDRRGSEPSYPPLRGGRHGGELLLEGPDGVYRVERFDARRSSLAVVRPDGSEGTEADLVALVGGADRQLFRSVFAFSLQELAGMETLSSEQVRARIFSAGVAGAGRSARDVIERLEQEAASLLSPRAGQIRELVKDAERLSDQVARARQRAAEYRQALGHEEEAEREVARLRAELAGAEASTRRFALLVDLWPLEVQRQETVAALGDLPVIDSFPADPDDRLATALSELKTASRAALDAEATRAELARRRATIEFDEGLPPVGAAAEALTAELAVQRERLTRIAIATHDLQDENGRVDSVLRMLGPSWTETRVRGFDVSLPAHEDVRGWQRRLEDAGEAARAAAGARASFERQVADVQERLALLEDRGGADRPARPAEEAVRATIARLTRVAEAVGQIEGRPVELVLDRQPIERAAGALALARQEYERRRSVLDDARERWANVSVDAALAALHENLAEAARHVEVERQRLRDIEHLAVAARERQEAVERDLRDLGGGWDESRVAAVAADLAQVQRVREFAARLQHDRERVADAWRELDHVGKGRSQREKDLTRLQEAFSGPEPMPEADLERQGRSLRRLRLRVSELAALASDRAAQERLKAHVAAERDAAARMQNNVLRLAPPAAALLAVLFALAGAWRLLVHDPVAAASLAVAALVAAAGAFVLRSALSGPGYLRDTERRRQQAQEADRALEELERRSADVRAAVEREAAALGLPGLSMPEDVEDRQEQWSRDRDARRRRDEQAAAAADLARELESWRRSEAARRVQYDEAEAHAVEGRRAWEDWLAGKGLPPRSTPDAARDFLEQARALQGRLDERDAARKRLAAERDAWDRWRIGAKALLREAGAGQATPSDAARLFDRLLDVERRAWDQASRLRERAAIEGEIAEWDAKVADAESTLERAEREAGAAVRDTIGRLVGAWRGGESGRTAARERLGAAERDLEDVTREWHDWETARGLETTLSPAGVLDLFAAIRRGHEAIARREHASRTVALLEEQIAAWNARVRDALERAGSPVPDAGADSWIEAAHELGRRSAADAANRAEAARVDEAIRQATLALDREQAGRDRAERALSGLLAEAGVPSEEAYRARRAQYRRRQDLTREAAGLEARILTALGRGDEADTLGRELREGRVGEWASERVRWSAEAERLSAAHEDAIRRHENLARERRALEEASEVADLELQQQALQTELDTAVRRRRVVSLAARLVAATLREFERTRQPAVLASASQAFERVTGGRYPRVVQAEPPEGVVVLDRRGARRTIGELSRGTREQLYLSMRLGLAREFARRAVALPLVMDDVLVNFDESRARRMAAELLAFASENQILLFTCHAPVRSLIVDLAPGTRVIELPVEAVGGEEETPCL